MQFRARTIANTLSQAYSDLSETGQLSISTSNCISDAEEDADRESAKQRRSLVQFAPGHKELGPPSPLPYSNIPDKDGSPIWHRLDGDLRALRVAPPPPRRPKQPERGGARLAEDILFHPPASPKAPVRALDVPCLCPDPPPSPVLPRPLPPASPPGPGRIPSIENPLRLAPIPHPPLISPSRNPVTPAKPRPGSATTTSPATSSPTTTPPPAVVVGTTPAPAKPSSSNPCARRPRSLNLGALFVWPLTPPHPVRPSVCVASPRTSSCEPRQRWCPPRRSERVVDSRSPALRTWRFSATIPVSVV